MKRNCLAIALVVAFAALVAGASVAYPAEGIGLRATVDKRSIFIGDRVKYVLEVAAPDDTEVKMPSFKDGIIGDFEIKDSASKTGKAMFRKRRYTNTCIVSAYSTGKRTIPPVEVQYRKKGSAEWRSQTTETIDITVESVLPKTGEPNDILDIKGPLAYFEINWFVIGAWFAGLVAALAAIVAYRRLRSRRPVRLPHETALEELEASRAEFLRSSDVKAYYVAISDCLRRYIERIFGIKAPEMTTYEFLNSLRDTALLTETHKELLREFMTACDLVKFAKYAPRRAEIESLYTTANHFIEQTKERAEA